MHFYTWEANYRASCGVCEPTPASGHVHTFSLPHVNVGVTINSWNVMKDSLKCMNFPLENSKVLPHIVFLWKPQNKLQKDFLLVGEYDCQHDGKQFK